MTVLLTSKFFLYTTAAHALYLITINAGERKKKKTQKTIIKVKSAESSTTLISTVTSTNHLTAYFAHEMKNRSFGNFSFKSKYLIRSTLGGVVVHRTVDGLVVKSGAERDVIKFIINSVSLEKQELEIEWGSVLRFARVPPFIDDEGVEEEEVLENSLGAIDRAAGFFASSIKQGVSEPQAAVKRLICTAGQLGKMIYMSPSSSSSTTTTKSSGEWHNLEEATWEGEGRGVKVEEGPRMERKATPIPTLVHAAL